MGSDLVGGQALVEGVMIRQGDTWSAAARRADGTIGTTLQKSTPALAPTRKIMFIRGVGALVDSVRIGLVAMKWSKDESASLDDEDADSPLKERVVVTGVVGGVLAVFLLVPLGVAALAHGYVGDGFGAALVEGLVRLGLFVAYLAMLSRLEGVRRTLEYHGAEHMVIAAHEHGVERSIASARAFSVRHPRCGTDFFLLIFVLSIIAFALVGTLPVIALIASRIVLAPVVVGVAYEILRAGGTSSHTALAKVLSAPGLYLQRFTTREPSDDQIEVAIAALDVLLPDDAQSEDSDAAVASPR